MATSDSWFDTLNDISDKYSEGKKARPFTEEVPKKKKDKSLVEARKSNAKDSGGGASSLNGLTAELLRSLTENNTGEFKEKEVDGEKSVPQTRAPVRKHSTIDRFIRRLTAGDGDEAKSIPWIREGPNTIHEISEALSSAFSPKSSEKLSDGPETSQYSNILEKMMADGEAMKKKEAEEPSRREAAQRARTEARHAVIEREARAVRALPSFTENRATPRIRLSSPRKVGETQPVEDISVPVGKSMHTDKQNSERKIRRKTEPVKEENASTTGGLTANGLDFRSSLAEWTLFGRVEKQEQSRTLPYGGASQQNSSESPGKVSFQSLRKADKVSPEAANPTIINRNPFGIVDQKEIGWGKSTASTTSGNAEGGKTLLGLRAKLPASYSRNGEAAPVALSEADGEQAQSPMPSDSEPAPKPSTVLAELHRSRSAAADAAAASSAAAQAAQPGGAFGGASGGASSAGSGDDSGDNAPDGIAGVSLGAAMKAPRTATRIRRTVGRDDAPKDAKPTIPEPPVERNPPAEKTSPVEESPPAEEEEASVADILSIKPSELHVQPLDIPQPPVPYLQHGLDRVLFNPGVYQLQDPSSRVYNFDPYLQNIMPVVEFDFDALKEYKTSSKDEALAAIARKHSSKYIGSTSSMTSTLTHFHFLLSNWRPVNLRMLSDGFVTRSLQDTFTAINRAPSSIFLRWKDGTYAIDADKEYDSANVLMLLGKSMELLLTLPKSEYERYRKSDPRQVPHEQKTAPESYQYSKMRDFLMRSQLDAYDPRLPGNGTFDLKTRAVVSIRMESKDFEPMTGYELYTLQGKWTSYEKEYYDMIRSTMLKYLLQARMGRMNGIYLAYHNVKRIFGFQYLPIEDMDLALHGQSDTCLGDQEFKASLELFNEVLNKATAKFPKRSLRIAVETKPPEGDWPTTMHVFAEPMEEEEIDKIQSTQTAKIAAWERDIMGKNDDSPIAQEDAVESSNSDGDNLSESEQAESTASSESNANVEFLGTVEKKSTEEDLKDLFYATIIVQSEVNGETLAENDRPSRLKPDDKWEIGSIVKEYPIDRNRWASYKDLKARRRFSHRNDEDDPEAEVKEDDHFIKFLKNISAQGKEWREQIDLAESGKKVVRVDEPVPAQGEKVENVEDYMKWLFKPKQKKEKHLFG